MTSRAIRIAQRTLVDNDALSAHCQNLLRPESIPLGIVLGIRDARIELDAGQAPTLALTDPFRELPDIVIRMLGAERLLSRVEQVLPIDEDDNALDGRLDTHGKPQKENPNRATRACRLGTKPLLVIL